MDEHVANKRVENIVLIIIYPDQVFITLTYNEILKNLLSKLKLLK
jgi:hypothetical protein